MEAELARRWARPCPHDRSLADLFGPYEFWLLTVGPHQLLLHPAVREWFYLDPVYEIWERTGFGPGEVLFVVHRGRLGATRQTNAAATDALLKARWFYIDGTRETGPVAGSEIRRKLDAGQLKARAMIRKEGSAFWRRAEWLAAPAKPAIAESTLRMPASATTLVEKTTILQSQRARLVVVSGMPVLGAYNILHAAVIGRSPESDVCLDDGRVSRRHFEIFPTPEGAWMIKDLGSANGTYLNRARLLRPSAIRSGDQIAISDLILRFETVS
jgi:hypothetical protein